MSVRIGIGSDAPEKQVCFIGSDGYAHSLERRDWSKRTPPSQEEAANTWYVCGHGWAWRDWGHRVQTTWILSLKGWPDRVNLNNVVQKTQRKPADFLTLPLLLAAGQQTHTAQPEFF